jgi:hypothetical protein
VAKNYFAAALDWASANFLASAAISFAVGVSSMNEADGNENDGYGPLPVINNINSLAAL